MLFMVAWLDVVTLRSLDPKDTLPGTGFSETTSEARRKFVFLVVGGRWISCVSETNVVLRL